MNKTIQKAAGIILVITGLVLSSAACDASAAVTTVTGTATSSIETPATTGLNTTQVAFTAAKEATNRLEVTLFYSPDNCACMSNAKTWIETTISADYAAQVANGTLMYRAYNADDSANAVVKQQFSASSLSFYFTSVQGTGVNTIEYKGLWLYLDTSLKNETLKAQFINLLKKELDTRLAKIA